MQDTRKTLLLFFLVVALFIPVTGFAQSVPKEKALALRVVEDNRKAIALLGDNIFYFAELGMQEFESTKLVRLQREWDIWGSKLRDSGNRC